MTLKALIFDVDGTLADTEAAHLAAFNESFQSMGIPWMWDVPTYQGLLMVSGGKERMRHYWATLMKMQPRLPASHFPPPSRHCIV